MVTTIRIFKWVVTSITVLIVLAILVYSFSVMSFDTENLPENHGSVDAQLFLGDGGNQPLIVGLGGSEGGNAWAHQYWADQRDVFISEGYAFLAIGYFGMEGTPKELDRISLDAVHQAIIDASNDPKINSQCIALIGGSKGAELALLLASEYSNIKAVVAMVPGNAVFAALTIAMNTPSFSLRGEPLEFVPVPWSATPDLIKGDLRAAWLQMLEDEDAMNNAAIQVENISGPIFFVSATKDEFWPSTEMSVSMEQRLEENNFPYYVEHLVVEGNHASVFDHFDEVSIFLRNNLMQENPTGCPR